jgi:murein DD-endopeptidase MepM/ murein hydrolase activator NlpD
MQILITHGRLARVRCLQLSVPQLVLAAAGLALALMLGSGAIYHFVFLKAVDEGWPLVSQVVRLVVRDEQLERDRFLRENLDAMAVKVGEMQAQVVRLQAVSERVARAAGLKPEELKALQAASAGAGGPYVPLDGRTLDGVNAALDALLADSERSGDLYTLAESRLAEQRMATLLVPSIAPVDGPVGSGFGVRQDPLTGRAALHTGLDFPADIGTPIVAAAGGVVIAAERDAAYGLAVQVDHGNGLVTRYAHTSKSLVKAGDLVRRGQPIAEVGNSGRSTGPHLHFEVLLDGAPQNPARFLAGAAAPIKAAKAR